MGCFEMTNLVQMDYYFKIVLLYLEEGIFMCQRHYIFMLELFGLVECNLTPMGKNTKLLSDMETPEVDSNLYQTNGRKTFLPYKL